MVAKRIELEESCNTALTCKCGSQQFRIHMEAEEETHELSTVMVNNVECQNCHGLYQLKFATSQKG